ncbi:WD40/YVTN/BNR-like repeat-containing protein [Streptomyces sp. NPDC001502]|uniref:WD40/YVTN/BNR-like repeat-containing protein n=1 Tax=Streptomyces sp. NPDC001502 TaxID=3364578 RepID=UPI00367B6F0A
MMSTSTTSWKQCMRAGGPASAVVVLVVVKGAVLAGTGTGLLRASLPVTGPDWESPDGPPTSNDHIIDDMNVWADDPPLVWRTERVGWRCAVKRSEDAGMTWQASGSWPESIFAIHIHPLNPDRVMHSFGYVNNNGVEVLGVRTTSDGGDSWEEHDHGRYYLDLVADPNDPDGNSVWMASHTNGLYRSGDFGSSWTVMTTHEANAVHFAGSRLLIGGDTIRYSDDDGTTFHAARIEGHDGPLRVVAFAQHNDVLFAASSSASYPGDTAPITAAGVLQSRDSGKTWTDASAGLPMRDVRTLAVDPGQPCLFAGLSDGSVHQLAL